MASTIRQRGASPVQQEKAQIMRDAEEKELSEGQKFVVPNYTNKQLMDAIPAHCFKRSALRSSLYIVQDVVAIGIFAYLAFQIDDFLAKFSLSPVAYHAARVTLYATYTVWAGFFGTGLWVIGHECGHQAFSSSKFINNTVGWFVHSALLVPYHAWRISHGRHHAATGHLLRDEVFVPRTRKERGFPEIKEEGELQGINISEMRQQEMREALGDAPIVTLYRAVLQQVFGWPMYLIRNAAGQLHYPAGTNHFNPKSIIFKPQHWGQIIASDIGLLITFSILGFWAYKRTVSEVVVFYVIPYLWVNHWLVFITYLQHTDPVLPHYSPEKWTFARGALATMDRNLLGPLGPIAFHGIAETHVSHHICSKIPHYHAWDATEALKKFLGQHYQQTDENMFYSYWRSFRECVFIEDGGDVLFFKNSAGLAKMVPVEEGGNVSDSGVDMGEAK